MRMALAGISDRARMWWDRPGHAALYATIARPRSDGLDATEQQGGG
jgi:hypothetical protein